MLWLKPRKAPGNAEISIDLPDAAATEALGARLARLLRAADVVALKGDLGAGKTTLARGLIRAMAADGRLIVPSPTFTLVETYETPRGVIWHFDLYRLERARDAYELGIEDAFASGISLIEWPERLGALLPPGRLSVTLSGHNGGRRADLGGAGSWPERLDGLG